MSIRGKTAFVTGGTGFIGGRLIEVLTSQFDMRVRALVRNNHAGSGAFRLAGCGAEIFEGDITDATRMASGVEGCDYVFHCAFGTTGDPKLDRPVTVGGTTSLTRAAAAAGVRHFVNLSTMVVFGETPDAVDESFAPRKMWDWPYPHEKLDAERAVQAEHARSGLPVTTLRLGTVYGPWGPAFTYFPISSLKSGRVVLVDDGAGVSNAVYVDDVIQAMVLAAMRGDRGAETFIVRGPDRVTWRQFYEAYQAMLNTDSLVAMTLSEVKAERRQQQIDAIKRAAPEAITVLKQDAGFKRLAGQLPLVKAGWKLYRRSIGKPPKILAPSLAPSESADGRPLIALPDMMWGYYASRTDFRIDRARERLGYQPAFDLARGMAITQAWAEWAGLIGPA
jgi:nucleoside-diphosphate-sugar epimerase